MDNEPQYNRESTSRQPLRYFLLLVAAFIIVGAALGWFIYHQLNHSSTITCKGVSCVSTTTKPPTTKPQIGVPPLPGSKKSIANNPSSKPKVQNSSNSSLNSSSTSSSSSTTSTSGTNENNFNGNTSALANTGPGDVIALFVVSSFTGAISYQILSRSLAKKDL